MKHLQTAAALALVSVLFACEPAVTFTEPQPSTADNVASFPKRLRGLYISPEDGSLLSITASVIEKSYDYERTLHPNELDSNTEIVNDTLVNLSTGEHTPLTFKDDSLILHIHCVDTLFQLDYDNVVRKYKGYYFTNTRYGKTSWEVKKIGLHKGQLTIGSISEKSDLDNLKALTETIADTIAPYKFTPDKKQFKQFVNGDGFSDREVYIRYSPH